MLLKKCRTRDLLSALAEAAINTAGLSNTLLPAFQKLELAHGCITLLQGIRNILA